MSTWYDTGFVMAQNDAQRQRAYDSLYLESTETRTIWLRDKEDESQAWFEQERKRGYRLAWNAAIPNINKVLDANKAICELQIKEIKRKEAELARIQTQLASRKKLDRAREQSFQSYENKLKLLRDAIDTLAALANNGHEVSMR